MLKASLSDKGLSIQLDAGEYWCYCLLDKMVTFEGYCSGIRQDAGGG